MKTPIPKRPPRKAEGWFPCHHYNELPKPALIHCSAGVDRTGAAVRHLKTVPCDSTN